jgi:hypothetical protein
VSGRYHINHTTRLARLADQAHEESNVIYYKRLETERADSVIFYDIFNQRFGELIVEECAQMCMSQADRKNLRRAFGLHVDSDVKYVAPDAHGSITSQYTRPYNLPKESKSNENT